MAAQQPYLPFTTGYDPKVRTELGEYDPARAKALLDMYGYVDRDGDGWRDMPDGRPLMLPMAAQTDGRTRKINEVFQKNMTALGIRTTFDIAQWPENLKAARAGNFALWAVGLYAAGPDGGSALQRYDSKQIGGQNMARFKMPAVDELYQRMQELPDGPERDALFARARRSSSPTCRTRYDSTASPPTWLTPGCRLSTSSVLARSGGTLSTSTTARRMARTEAQPGGHSDAIARAADPRYLRWLRDGAASRTRPIRRLRRTSGAGRWMSSRRSGSRCGEFFELQSPTPFVTVLVGETMPGAAGSQVPR